MHVRKDTSVLTSTPYKICNMFRFPLHLWHDLYCTRPLGRHNLVSKTEELFITTVSATHYANDSNSLIFP